MKKKTLNLDKKLFLNRATVLALQEQEQLRGGAFSNGPECMTPPVTHSCLQSNCYSQCKSQCCPSYPAC